jgi:hypothetical protein
MKPFFEYTQALSKTRDVTAHLVYRIYNTLFKHLKQLMKQLRRKRVLWKKQILEAFETSRSKLAKYYLETDHA